MTKEVTNKSIEESLWNICLETRAFLDKLKSSGIDLGSLSGDMQTLIRMFEPLMKEKRFSLLMGDIYYNSRQYKKFLAVYEDSKEELPEGTIEKLGDVCVILGDLDKAQEYFDKLLEANEENHAAWYKKASLLFTSGTALEDSVFYLERALELKPDYIDALILMAKAWMERANVKKDSFIKKRMKKEAIDCLGSAEEYSNNLLTPEKEFNLSRIYAILSRIEPEKSEEFWKTSLDNLEEVLKVEGQEKLLYLEKVKQENSFAEMGLVLDFPVTEEAEEDERVPAKQDTSGDEDMEEEVDEDIDEEDEDEAETAEEDEEDEVVEEDEEEIDYAEPDFSILDEKTEAEGKKIADSSGGASYLSPSDMFKDESTGVKPKEKKADYKADSYQMLRPEDLGL